jgi:hypothetical protein
VGVIDSGSVSAHDIEQAFLAFVANDEVRTRSTVEGWCQRLDVLAQFFPNGLDGGPAMSDISMQIDVLYWMADALVWQGFPGRALTAFAQHDALCRTLGAPQARRLAAALAHHSEALRQCGRLHDADLVAREGLDLQRRVGDPFTLAVQLFRFGLGLSYRGEVRESAAALDESTEMLDDHQYHHKGTEKAIEVSLLLAERARLQHDIDATRTHVLDALRTADHSPAHRDAVVNAVHNARLRARATRLLAETSLLSGQRDEAVGLFASTLRQADSVRLVDEVAHSLCGLARCALMVDDLVGARRWIDAMFPLVQNGPYPIHDANAHLLVAMLEQQLGHPSVAQHATDRAQQLRWCDGPPFSYTQTGTAHQY